MPRFDFMSPGAAATSQIQEFLQQRHAEERQAMLDKLNEENMRSEMAARAGHLDIAKSTDARAGQQFMENALNSQHERGISTRTEDRQQRESDFKLGAEDRQRGYIDELLKTNPTLSSNPEASQILNAARAGVNLPYSAVEGAPSFTTISPSGKVLGTTQLPKHGQALELNWSPAAYFGGAAANAPALYQLYKDGQFVQSGMFTPTEADAAIAQGYELRKGNTPPEKAVTGTITNALTRAKQLFDQEQQRSDSRAFSSWRSRTPEAAAAEQGYYQALGAVFAAVPNATPGLQDLAMGIIREPLTRDLSIQQLVDGGAIEVGDGPEQVTQRELMVLQDLLNYGRGVSSPQAAPATPQVPGGLQIGGSNLQKGK